MREKDPIPHESLLAGITGEELYQLSHWVGGSELIVRIYYCVNKQTEKQMKYDLLKSVRNPRDQFVINFRFVNDWREGVEQVFLDQ